MLAEFDELLTCVAAGSSVRPQSLARYIIRAQFWQLGIEIMGVANKIAVSRILPHFGWQTPAISFSKVGSTAEMIRSYQDCTKKRKRPQIVVRPGLAHATLCAFSGIKTEDSYTVDRKIELRGRASYR